MPKVVTGAVVVLGSLSCNNPFVGAAAAYVPTLAQCSDPAGITGIDDNPVIASVYRVPATGVLIPNLFQGYVKP